MQPIADWLAKLGMSEYAERFAANRIDVSVLPDLTDQDLETIGVLLGDRRKMLRAIRELTPAGRPAAQDPAPPPPMRDEAERRQLTIMFCDLVGSTALSAKLDPEDLRGLVRDYHHCCTGIVERNGGYVAKYMGDGVLAYFGYPQAHEHDAECAVQAGLALVEAVPNLKTSVSSPLQVRVGIATGIVVVGDLIGRGAAQEQAVVGETPNLAARLQAVAEPGSVVVAAATRTLLGNLFEFQDLGWQELKGISGPVRAWAALRSGYTESRFDALHTAGLTRLVGRKEEIELLLRRWSTAKLGEGQVVLLSGEAGIGKSRIAAAIMEQIAAEPHTRLRYFCSPQHTDSAFHPIAGQMERAAGLVHTDRPRAKLDKLDALLARTSTLPQEVALLAGMLSLPSDGRYPNVELTPEQRKHRTLEALTSQLVRLSTRNPVLMIFEDVHWIDPTSLEVLDLLVRRIAALHVLLLITFRPEFKAPWEGQAHVRSLTLNRLPSRDAAAIIADLVGSKELAADVSAEIVERTDGIPLFVEEMTKAVLEAENEGAARRVASTIPSHAKSIPASLHASLLARLDRLGRAKDIAQIGAAVGREFSHALLEAVAQRDKAELAEALARLVEAGLLFRQGVPPDANYLFKHALVQDVAYETLLREKRQQLHARIATVLDREFAVGDSQPELLARHYTLAAMPREAIKYWQRAGERATKASANKEAITHFRNALELLEALPERTSYADKELQLLLALGPALMTTRSSVAPEIGQVYARARELASAGQQVADLFPTVWGAWLVAFSRGDFPTAARLVDELFGMTNASRNSELTLQAHHAAWSSLWVGGELSAARHHIEKGVSLYRPEAHGQHALQYGGHDPGVCAYVCDAVIATTMGAPARGLDDMEKALTLARRLDHPPTLVQALWFAAELHQIRREPAKVEDYVSENLPLLALHGSAVAIANATMLRGWARVMQADTDRGIALMQEGLANWRKTGSKFHVPFRLARAAETHLMAGRIEDGLRLIGEAGGGTGDLWFAPELDRLKGELLVKTGAGEQAESCLRRALEAAHAQGARLLELRAALSVAKLLETQGRRSEAENLLAPIYRQFDEGLETADLRNARDWLES
ncbi:MAG: AAA family ATPase [Bradyrhizobium sp.]|nr:AAA family ATPase [Bradyrhizobium sp.]